MNAAQKASTSQSKSSFGPSNQPGGGPPGGGPPGGGPPGGGPPRGMSSKDEIRNL